MRQIIFLFYLFFVISCNQNTKTKEASVHRTGYGVELIDNGFLKYADSADINTLKKQVKDSFNIYDEENFRIAIIDAEELAEMSFDFFVPSLNRILGKRKIHLSVKKLNKDDNSFDILINGDTIKLFTQKELDNETFWDTAPRNFFQKVNEILRLRNSDEQFYLLYGGNDLQAMLLTEKHFSIIVDYYKNEPKFAPYRP